MKRMLYQNRKKGYGESLTINRNPNAIAQKQKVSTESENQYTYHNDVNEITYQEIIKQI